MFINNLFNHLQNFKQERQQQLGLVFPVIFFYCQFVVL